MNLLVGLGNPGIKHTNDRHNVGFMALDKIAESYQFSTFRNRKRFFGDTAEGKISSDKIIALKPTTFMNNSGKSIAATIRFHKLLPNKVIIFHDELDLKPGKVRAKLGGSDAGHNGLKSISAQIGSNYWRVRIGIGRPNNKSSTKNYVLNNFDQNDSDWLKVTLESIADSITYLLEAEANKFMTKIAHHSIKNLTSPDHLISPENETKI